MTWIDILERTDHERASQEITLESCYKILEELKRIIEVKNRNENNESLKEFHNNRLKQIKRVFMNITFALSGWMTDYEVSSLIYNYNTLEKKARLI